MKPGCLHALGIPDDTNTETNTDSTSGRHLNRLVWSALPLFSSRGSIPSRTFDPGLFTTDYGSFSSSCSVVWLTSYSSRVDSAMRGSSISFLTRARSAWLDSCLGWLLCILVRCHVSKGITGQLGTGLAVSELFSERAVLHSPYQSATCSIFIVKQRARFTRSESWTYRRRTVSEDRWRVQGSEVQIFTVSLNEANILSTPIHSLTSRELRGMLRQVAEPFNSDRTIGLSRAYI